MAEGRDCGRRSFLGSTVPPAFSFRRLVLAPGDERVFDDAEWEDTIVVVEHGQLELECRSGDRLRFGRGDVFWLTGLPLRALHCCEGEPTVLIAVSRPER